MNLVLAVDLSTTVCGYALFNKDTDKLFYLDFYKFESIDLIDRAQELDSLLTSIKNTLLIGSCIITDFVIEERLKSFRSGGTNASAMLNTAQMNFLCQYLVKNMFGFNLIEINVNAARSACFPGFHKIARATAGVKQKEIAFSMVMKQIGEDKFPKKILKSGVRKGVEVFLEEAKDMSDAYILGKAFLNNKNNGTGKKTNEKITKRTGGKKLREESK